MRLQELHGLVSHAPVAEEEEILNVPVPARRGEGAKLPGLPQFPQKGFRFLPGGKGPEEGGHRRGGRGLQRDLQGQPRGQGSLLGLELSEVRLQRGDVPPGVAEGPGVPEGPVIGLPVQELLPGDLRPG